MVMGAGGPVVGLPPGMMVGMPPSMPQNLPNSGPPLKRKKKSRWGGDQVEKAYIPGMPTVIPQGLSKNQEEMYLSKC